MTPAHVDDAAAVRQLAGSGISFADRGLRQLKGVPGEWHLFSAVT